MRPRGREPALLLALTVLALAASGVAPYERGDWLFEAAWVVGGLVALLATRRRFPLTPLLYRLLFLHALVLIVGGYYSYPRVPLFDWLRDEFGLRRNHYDRLAHFVQGFVPAMLVRELLLRRTPLRPGPWAGFLAASVSLAFSACFEILEWWLALVWGREEVLQEQGDPWDTQWDLFMALLGAAASQLLLARPHDRQLQELGAGRKDRAPA